MKYHENVLAWAMQYLASSESMVPKDYQQVTQTAYSIVHRIETNKGYIYLKQTPEALSQEPTILTFLQQLGCKNIPNLIAENKAYHCFLMSSCGDESLRHLFKGRLDVFMLEQGILNFTQIERMLETQVQNLLSMGVPDWRLNKITLLYEALIQQDKFLSSDGLTLKEIDSLHKLYPTVKHLSKTLGHFQLPETLSHCDFHDKNMLLDDKNRTINIIDWGETVISHPFFSLTGCLWNLTYFYHLNLTDSSYKYLQKQCIRAWLEFYDEDKLLKAFNIAEQLNSIYAALSYDRIYKATAEQTLSVQQTHPGSIAGCLKSFIQICNKL